MRALLLLSSAVVLTAGSRPPDIPWVKHEIDLGASETCAFADINNDGKLDIVSGESWYEAPSWRKHRFREIPFANNYVDNFSDLPLDVDGDGRIDIVGVAWFSKRIVWWKNSGDGMWKEEVAHSGSPVEFAFLVDLDNDGKALEILPQFGSDKEPLAWFEAKGGKLVKHVVSPKSYGHGIGAGDVNGDGRNDILVPEGWLEAPADPRTENWTLHSGFPKGGALSFLHVGDVNGDKRNDVITANGHDYGVFWYEQGPEGQWTKRLIDDSWSQSHAVTFADLNGDGRKDILTGKRYMAHNGKDPGEREPLGVYWYEQTTNAEGKTDWVRHLIDYGTRTGGGLQIPVADLDGDGDLDFAVAGKSGLYLFENKSGAQTAKRR